MSKITIVEGNSNDKDNVRVIMVKGEKGYSAYEIAVQNGYTGTEEEWKDSFLNAENYYNKSEVNSMNDNLSNSIDQLETTVYGEISSNVANLNNTINEEKTVRQNADNSLQSQISSLASGSPLVASSTSGMTDTTKVYVNTTDGYWYYYNGTDWVAGGVYQGTELDIDLLRGIFTRKLNIPKYVWLSQGGINLSTGATTTTNSRFRCNGYFRNGFIIKNNNTDYGIDIHLYTVNEDFGYSHINGEKIAIEDNLYHYVNFTGATNTRITMFSKDSSVISPDNYADIFSNIEFYVIPTNNKLDDLAFEPEEYVNGAINTLSTSSAIGSLYKYTNEYNYAHYLSPAIKFDVDKIVSVKIKKNIETTNTFGFNLYVYNGNKYFITYRSEIKKDIDILLKAGYTLFICFYRGNNTRFDVTDINKFFDIQSQEYQTNSKNLYKIPLVFQQSLFINDIQSSNAVVQGITSDEDNIYTSTLINSTNNRCVISKIPINDTTNITRTEERSYYHANGLAYNDKDSLVAIANMDNNVSLINSDTLVHSQTVDIQAILSSFGININNVSSIAYNNEFNIYCLYCIPEGRTSFSPRYFILFDSNFNFIKKIEFIAPGNISYTTTGGVYLTDNYIILCNYDASTNNRLLFYNWNGTLISYLDINLDIEIEGITINNDTLYLAFNYAGHTGYKVYCLKPYIYEIKTETDIDNDFKTMRKKVYQNIINVDSRTDIYNDIKQIPNESEPLDWY